MTILIGFDLNGVLAEANVPLCEDIKHKYGLSIDPASITTYGEIGHRLAEYINRPRETHPWIRNHINSPEFILKLTPIEGAQELWESLSCEKCFCEKRIVSGHAQNPETEMATRRWLEMHGFKARLDFTKYKDSWARQVRADYLVEDSPLHAHDLSEAGISVFLLNKSYNQGLESPKIIRISALLDILSELDRISPAGLP